ARLSHAFIVGKEKHLVAIDTTADISAELVQTKSLLTGECVVRIHTLVAEVIEEATVISIRSRLRDRIDHRTQRLSVLRRIILLDNLDFLDTVHADAIDARFDASENIRRAVDVDATRIDAIDEHARSAECRRDAVDRGLKL